MPDLAPPVTSKTVGPILVPCAEGARQTKRYQAVDQLLAPFMASAGGSIEVVRA